MKDNIYSLYDLKNNQIDYCSFTIFKDGIAITSHCNNEQWLEYYQREYNSVTKKPPVQDYLIHSNTNLIVWDYFTLASSTTDYIRLRNKAVGVINNSSLLFRHNGYLSTLTIGTNIDLSDLLDFINHNQNYLFMIMNDLLQKSVARQPMSSNFCSM